MNLKLKRLWVALASILAGCVASDPALHAAINDVQSRPQLARKALRPYAEKGEAIAIAHICVAFGGSID